MITKHLPTIILASSSPARKMLLTRLQIPFQFYSPDVDETPQDGESPEALVTRLALKKATSAIDNYPNSLIIGCDQVGVLDNEILCKPITHDNAVKQLLSMSGRRIKFLTGICLYDTRTQMKQESTEIYYVTFRALTQAEIEDYLHREKPYQCAGSVQVEGLGISLLEKLEGNDYTSLIGLPLIRLVSMFKNL